MATWKIVDMAKSKEDQLQRLNIQRETWCRVETPRNFWNLPQRKHFRCHLRSGCELGALQTARPEERSAWMTSSDEASHPERRHFEDQHYIHLV
ncbi:hypothetical protein DNTS_028474 [Danionella cerebrum]|uniref:Uncharacterized protein n=1 Tax=Danionella cerebrum TaxID=2873325 RepID=A0A553R7E6_9TELE|nr:hypothetical protein DNTS_028474 [Danionella translucida]